MGPSLLHYVNSLASQRNHRWNQKTLAWHFPEFLVILYPVTFLKEKTVMYSSGNFRWSLKHLSLQFSLLTRKESRPWHIRDLSSWLVLSLHRVRSLRFSQMACLLPGSSSTTQGAPCVPDIFCSSWATAIAFTWTCSPFCATSGSWRKTKVSQDLGREAGGTFATHGPLLYSYQELGL